MTPENQPRHRFASLFGLSIALIVPALPSALPPDALPFRASPVDAILVNEAGIWTLTLAVLAVVVFWERRPLMSIGLGRPTRAGILAGGTVAAGLILLAILAALAVEAAGLPISGGQEEMLLGIPLWLQLAVAASAGFCEEVLFRGYAIERLTELTRSRWLGAILPILVFGALHAPFWGWPHAIVAGMSGLWLTLLYLWRRNLWTNITAHALLDGLVFVAMDLAGAG